jgi:hypothetical protein
MNFFCLQTQGLYPKTRIDVEVSSGEDDAPKPDASASKQKESVGDDVEDGGVSSAESIAPNPISSGAPEHADHSTADRVATIVPFVGGRGCKHPAATMQNKSIL